MILTGRKRHWWSWLALALLVPAILIAACIVRRPPPVNDRLPSQFLESSAP
jgi:hypothetical protein